MSPILVPMSGDAPTPSPIPQRQTGSWSLQDARNRFSELVSSALCQGPQYVTINGREEVVVIRADEFRRLMGERSGAAIVATMQGMPYRDIDLDPERFGAQVSDVKL